MHDVIKNAWVFRYLLKIARGEPVHQTYFIPATTCRYPNQVVRLEVCPDMQWSINVNFNIDDPLYYRNTAGMLKYYDRARAKGKPVSIFSGDRSGNIHRKRDKAARKMVASELSGSERMSQTHFQLHAQCEYNNGETLELTHDLAEKFRSMLAPLLWIKDKLDGELGVSEARQAEARIKATGTAGLRRRLSQLPMRVELIAPNIGVGVGIGYGETQGPQVGHELDGRLIMNPIIGADLRLDVLALGSDFKPWGAIIDALDIAAWAVGFCSGGRAQVDYKIDIVFSSQIKLVGSGSKDGTDTPARIGYNFASQKFSGNVALQGVIEGRIEASLEMILKVEQEYRKGFDSSINPKKKRTKAFEMGVSAEASTWISLTFGKEFGKSNNFETDFYFSGVSLKVTFKGGFNKEKNSSSLIKIVPEIDTKFDILKNQGEYK